MGFGRISLLIVSDLCNCRPHCWSNTIILEFALCANLLLNLGAVFKHFWKIKDQRYFVGNQNGGVL